MYIFYIIQDVVRVNVFFFLSSLQVIKVYNEDNTSRAVEVPTDITARDICQLFVMKNHCIDDHSWTLFEQLSHPGIGKNVNAVHLYLSHQRQLRKSRRYLIDTFLQIYKHTLYLIAVPCKSIQTPFDFLTCYCVTKGGFKWM